MVMLIKAAGKFFVFTYVALIGIFLSVSITPYLNPASFWFVGFAGLAYPYVFLALLIMTIFCIPIRPRLAIVGLVAIVLSLPNIGNIFGLNRPTAFDLVKKEGHIRVMSWNIRRFTPYDKDYFDPGRTT